MEIFKKFFNVDQDHQSYIDGEETVDQATDEEAEEAQIGQIALDVFENLDGIVIVAPLAGVQAQDVDVNLVKNVLTITGIRKKPEIYSEFIRGYVEECYYGPFSRSIILPENLLLEQIRATTEKGLLTITIPKSQPHTQSIKIEQLEDFS